MVEGLWCLTRFMVMERGVRMDCNWVFVYSCLIDLFS